MEKNNYNNKAAWYYLAPLVAARRVLDLLTSLPFLLVYF